MLSYPTDQFFSHCNVRCPLYPLPTRLLVSSASFAAHISRIPLLACLYFVQHASSICRVETETCRTVWGRIRGRVHSACTLDLLSHCHVRNSAYELKCFLDIEITMCASFDILQSLYWNFLFVFLSTFILDTNGTGKGTYTQAPLREISCVVIMIWAHCCRNSLSSAQRCFQTFQLNGFTIVFDG